MSAYKKNKMYGFFTSLNKLKTLGDTSFAEVHREQLFGFIMCAVATYVFAHFL